MGDDIVDGYGIDDSGRPVNLHGEYPPGWEKNLDGRWEKVPTGDESTLMDFSDPVTVNAADGLVNGKASDTYAQISREQWEDYKNRFIPLEDRLLNAYDNQDMKQQRLADVTKSANAASDNAVYAGKRQLARYGLNYGDQKGIVREAGLLKATNAIDAQNNNRGLMAERDEALLSGGVTARGV
jgi:hypothetical protein